MALKVYRYRHEGPKIEKLRVLAGSAVTVVSRPAATPSIDISIEARRKPDLDETMAEFGYIFVQEVP